MKMEKYLRPEQLADLFLSYLFLNREDGAGTLSRFSDSSKIYLDGQLAGEIIELLYAKKLIKAIQGSLDVLAFPDERPRSEEQIMQPAQAFDGFSIEGNYPHFEITPRGRAFVSQGQRLDIQGVVEEKENARKWKDRGINFVIAIATAFLIFLLTEPVKRKFEDVRTKKQMNSESSPLRPSVDGRQRPEP